MTCKLSRGQIGLNFKLSIDILLDVWYHLSGPAPGRDQEGQVT